MQRPSNQIIIEFIRTGVVVYMPDRNVPTDEYQDFLIERAAQAESEFINQIESTDPLLRKIKSDNSPFDSTKKFRKLSVSEISEDSDVWSFKNINEALDFIHNEFKDDKSCK